MTIDSPPRPASVKRSVVLALAAYALFDLGLPLVHVRLRGLGRPELAALILLPTCLFMLLQLWLSRALVGLRPSVPLCLATMFGSVVLWFLTLRFLHPYPHIALDLYQRIAINVGLALIRMLLLGLFITLACTFFGILLSRIVREANILLPVALVAMPVDYLGAMTKIGFTQNVLTRHPEVVHAVSVPVPTIGGLQPISFIGPGDALFMAFFFAVVLRLNLNDRATFWWMYALLTIAMLLVLTLSNFSVAALVPMGLAVIAANARFFRLQRSEAFAVLYALLLVLALAVGFFCYSHSHFFRH